MAEASDLSASGRVSRLLRQFPPRVEHTHGHTCLGGTHSRTHDGRIVCWAPEVTARVAIDAEVSGRDGPAALRARSGLSGDALWQAWTRTEVAAKILDVPIMTWVSRHGLVVGPIPADAGGDLLDIVVYREGDLIVAAGMLTAGVLDEATEPAVDRTREGAQ